MNRSYGDIFLEKLTLSLRVIKVSIYVLLDSLVTVYRARNNARRTICLVRVDNIGDFVLWLDAARQIRMNFDREYIVLVANSSFSELANALPYWDEVVSVDVRRFTLSYLYRHKLMLRIRRLGADVVIQPTVSRVFMTGDSVVRISGAKSRIGVTGDLSNISEMQQRISDAWYTDLHRTTPAVVTELEKNLEFLHFLGIETASLTVPKIPALQCSKYSRDLDDEYCIVFPGASWHGKMWSEEMYARCAEYLYLQFGWKTIVCGGANDVERCSRICAEIHTHEAINMSGKTSLIDLVELIRKAKILIGNDTSAVHIAAAVNTPSVCVLGGGHYGRFLPYPESAAGTKPEVAMHSMPCFGCNWSCVYPLSPECAMPCIQSVELHAVLAAVDRALGVSCRRGAENYV